MSSPSKQAPGGARTLTAACRATRAVWRMEGGSRSGSNAASMPAGLLPKDARKRRSTSSVPPACITEVNLVNNLCQVTGDGLITDWSC